jgi:hypothetical protein
MLASIIAWVKGLFSTKKLGILLIIFAKKTITPVI